MYHIQCDFIANKYVSRTIAVNPVGHMDADVWKTPVITKFSSTKKT